MKILVSFLTLFLYINAHAQRSYNASLIPDSLKENADAVKRIDELKITIKNVNEAVIVHKYAITILNEKGNDQSVLVEPYDKKNIIEDINGTLYDENGNKIKNLKRKDISDKTLDGDENLITDTRYKTVNFYYSKYPYTVEYEIEMTIKSLFFLPKWHPIDDYRQSIESSTLTIESPLDYNVRFFPMNLPKMEPTIKKEKTNQYQWAINNFKAIEFERFAPTGISSILPKIIVAPSQFYFDQYAGNMDSWTAFGKFSFQLYENRNTIPDNLKSEIHSLTDGLPRVE